MLTVRSEGLNVNLNIAAVPYNSDLLKVIFSNFDSRELTQVMTVCKAWNSVANSDRLWQNLCTKANLFPRSPLEKDEAWKDRFKQINRWLKGNCTEEAQYNGSHPLIALNKNIYSIDYEDGNLHFHDLENNNFFSLPCALPLIWTHRIHVFPSVILIKEEHEYKIFDRITKQLIRNFPHQDQNFDGTQLLLNNDYLAIYKYDVLNQHDSAKIYNIRTGKVIWSSQGDHHILGLQDDHLFCKKKDHFGIQNSICFMDLSADSKVWQQIPHSIIDLSSKFIYTDENRLLEFSIYRETIIIKVWNIKNLNEEPRELCKIKLPYPEFKPNNGFYVNENILVLCKRNWNFDQDDNIQNMYVYDMNKGNLLFTREYVGRNLKIYVDKTRIVTAIMDKELAIRNGSFYTGIVIYDFGIPTLIKDPISIKMPIKNPKKINPVFKGLKTALKVSLLAIGLLILFVALGVLGHSLGNFMGGKITKFLMQHDFHPNYR